jgi:hypothetical protein
MNQVERRESNRDPKDELLPEILALLRSCGAEIRESDRQRLREAEAAKPGEPWDRRRGDRRGVATPQTG